MSLQVSRFPNPNLGFSGQLFIGGDFGASKKGGSGRVFIFDKSTGAQVGTSSPNGDGSAFVSPGGLGNNEKKYTTGLANLIAQVIDQNKEAIGKRKIAGIVAAAPAQTTFIDGKPIAPVVANIKTDDEKPIRADFREVETKLAAKGIKLASTFKNFIVNDMNMWTLQTGMAHKDELKEGFKYATFINGGGFGAGFGEVLKVGCKNYLHIRATEEGHVNKAFIEKPGDVAPTLESENCSSPALIKNWGEKIGLKDEKLSQSHKERLNNDKVTTMLDVLASLGNSEIVTTKDNKMTISLKNKSDEEKEFLRTSIDVLKDSQILQVNRKDDEIFGVEVKSEKQKAAKEASKSAIDKYVDGLAFLSHIHACDGLNRIYLIGPLNAKGVANYVGGPEKLGEIVTKRTFEKLDAAGANIATLNNFKVVVNKDIEDSQPALKTLTKGKFMENTGNSYIIDTEKL